MSHPADSNEQERNEGRERHERLCHEGDGWSHSFHVCCNNEDNSEQGAFGRSYPGQQHSDITPSNITSIRRRSDRYMQETNTFGYYTAENWQKVGAALNESSVLVQLNLADCQLTKETAEAFVVGCRNNYTWPLLKELNLSGTGYNVIKAFLPIMKSRRTLDTLNLSFTNLGINGAKLVADVLNQCTIKNLHLNRQQFKDQGLECILSSRNARHIVQLHINFGHDKRSRFSESGFEALSRFLRENTQLTILEVDTYNYSGTNFDKMLVESISKESKLKAITISNYIHDDVYDYALNLVCDTSSFESLCSSNHHLGAFGGASYDGSPCNTLDEKKHPKLCKSFDINNQGTSAANKIRRKLRNFYFKNSEFDVKAFNDIDVALMPYILGLVTMIEMEENSWMHRSRKPRLVPSDNLIGLYRLLRNCHVPELLSFPSTESLLKQKDEKICQLEVVNVNLKAVNESINNLKAENECIKQKLDQLTRENEELRRAASVLPNKRAKTVDVESRFAALEADVAMLKQKSL